MASNIATPLNALVSHIASLGYFDRVNTVEPKAAPGNGLFCSLFFRSMRPIGAGSGLDRASAVYVFTARLYCDFLREPADNIDQQLITAMDAITDSLAGDVTLGANVREVDAFGEYGQGMDATAGYVEVSGTMYRTIDLQLPLVVNDSMAAWA